MTDRTTKTLLALIAAALWLQLLATTATPTAAQGLLDTSLRDVVKELETIRGEVRSFKGAFDSWSAIDAGRRR